MTGHVVNSACSDDDDNDDDVCFDDLLQKQVIVH